MKILLVEDNEINQMVAEEMLTQAGLKVTLAADGAQALRLLDEQTFDLVLMDIQMPGMDGLAATAELRKQPRFKTLPIIAMTAHAMEGDAQKSLDAFCRLLKEEGLSALWRRTVPTNSAACALSRLAVSICTKSPPAACTKSAASSKAV